MKSPLLTLSGIMLLPALWLTAADLFGIVTPALLPPLHSVMLRFGNLISDGTLLDDIGMTCFRWLSGYSFGVVLGVLAGLVLGSFRAVRQLFSFPVEFLRAMPVTAIFPLFLVIFGIGDEAKIAMAFTPTFLLMLINTSYGVTLAEPARRRMAAAFGATPLQVFRLIVTMDALPQIFVGLRLSLSLSLVVAVVSEMFIGTDFGLGQRVYDSYLTSSMTTLYALLIVLGCLGFLANKLLLRIERRCIGWATV